MHDDIVRVTRPLFCVWDKSGAAGALSSALLHSVDTLRGDASKRRASPSCFAFRRQRDNEVEKGGGRRAGSWGPTAEVKLLTEIRDLLKK